MSKIYMNRTWLLFTFFIFQIASAQTLVHYWNFNNNSSVATLVVPSSTIVPGAAINVLPGGSSVVDAPGGTGQNFNVQNLNARNGDPAGSHLRFNNPIGGTLEFVLPTTGYLDPVVRFATRRSGSGAGTQVWSYSLDGTTFIPFFTMTINDDDPELKTLDFSAIAGADNNPDFKLRVAFTQGAGGNAGNNRFDNFTLDATAMGGDVNPPVLSFSPLDGAFNISTNVAPSIQFSEDVRLVAGNAAIDNNNIDAVIDFRLNDASGTPVPFDATFSTNTIFITPAAPLLNSQTYYLALLPDTIEDVSDNAIVGTNAITFTTLAPQPSLTGGDIVFVGYRMSADGEEDEIAFVPLKSLTPGTIIYFTDSKYTTNAQAQCDGGIEWTSPNDACVPAGTVITLQTDTLVTNLGTTTGEGFGLSSNGDQVIAYAGSAASPTYLAALSSNAWVATNTSCGGSNSMIPAGLVNGTSAISLQSAPGSIAGNAANAYYNGSVTGTPEQIRMNVSNAGNWIASASATPPQTWPSWAFPAAVQVTNVSVDNDTTITVTFSGLVNPSLGSDTDLFTGIDGLSSAVVSGNTVILTYGTPFGNSMYTLNIGDVIGSNGFGSGCPYTFTFDGSLSAPDFNATRFAMYPNPAKGTVHFSMATDVEVYHISGKKVLSASNTASINISGLAKGVYIVKTVEGFSQKLLVE